MSEGFAVSAACLFLALIAWFVLALGDSDHASGAIEIVQVVMGVFAMSLGTEMSRRESVE